MAKYEVVRPWFGVKVGDVVDFKELHPALKSNVRLMKGEAGGELKPATPDAGTGEKSRKEIIQDRLTQLGIEFKGTWALKSSVSCCRMANSKSFSLLNNSRR